MNHIKTVPPPGHPFPRPLFTCDHPGCAQEARYAAHDLCWYATGKQWICFNCWPDLPAEPDESNPAPGITLEEYGSCTPLPRPVRDNGDDPDLDHLAREYVTRTDDFRIALLTLEERRRSHDYALQVYQETLKRAEAAGYSRLQFTAAVGWYRQRKEQHG